jgi:hypothetical protein
MGGTVAHPKLSTVFNRSLLAASTAALIAGPLAAAGSAQSLDTVTGTTSNVVDLTCDEAKETKDLELIAEFCDADELPAPLAKATEDAEKKLKQESEKVTATVESTTGVKSPSDGDGGSGDGGGGSNPDSSPTGVLPTSGSSDSDKKAGGKNSRQVRGQGAQPRGISGGTRGEAAKTGNYGNSSYSGMRSNSALTLQPFAAPLVSVPPIYELPQVAQQLFGLDEAATTGDPMVAMAGDATATSAYSTTGFGGTPADPTGWLAATATGLIMLLGAAHALNGARTPKRKRA